MGSTAWKNCDGSSIAGGKAAAAADAAACCRLEEEADAELSPVALGAEVLADEQVDELLEDVGAAVDQANGL